MELDPSGTALLIIDMQRDFLDDRGYAAQAGLDIARLRCAIDPIRRLLQAARHCGLFVVHTREGHRADLADCAPTKLARSARAGASIGSNGPLGRLLVRGEYGHDFVDELQPIAGEAVVDKSGYSAFHGTDLHALLRTRGIGTVLITGVTTEVCVSSTLRSAVDRGFACITVRDGCASAYPDLHDAALRMIGVEGGIFGSVMETAQVVQRL